MNVLFITRKVDDRDWLAGFTCRWIESLSGKVDRLEILCLEKGEHSLKVPVHSMGRELGNGRLGKLLAFHRHITSSISHVDIVFCHMNPIYAVLAAPYVRLFGKRLVLWYAHGHVSTLLKLAARLSDRVLTSTSEGYRLDRPKATVIGQGIDLEKFTPSPARRESYKILSVGRISPVKNLALMIDAMAVLVKEKKNLHLTFAGGPGRVEQKDYLRSLQSKVEKMGLTKWVSFIGPVPHTEIPSLYRQSDLFCTTSDTGSLDKTILEAMASGIPVIGSNKAFTTLALANGLDELVVEKKDDAQVLAETIHRFWNLPRPRRRQLIEQGRKIAAEHDLDGFTDRLVEVFQQVKRTI